MRVGGKLSTVYCLIVSWIKVILKRLMRLRCFNYHRRVIVFIFLWCHYYRVLIVHFFFYFYIILIINFLLLERLQLLFLVAARVVCAPLFEHLLSRRRILLYWGLLLNGMLQLLFFFVFVNDLIDHPDPVFQVLWLLQNTNLRLFFLMLGCILAAMCVWKLLL